MGADEYPPEVQDAIMQAANDGAVTACCTECDMEYLVEPDAEGYDCHDGCGATGTVTSPLRKAGLI